MITYALMDGWPTINVILSRLLVILERWIGNNEMLCAMELRLRLKRFQPLVGIEPGTPRSAG